MRNLPQLFLTAIAFAFWVTSAYAEKDVSREVSHSPLHKLPKPVLWLIAALCLVWAACMAGLTLGLMTLDTVGLELMLNSSNQKEAAAARKIIPVRRNAHLLLVTLLLGNTIATELLPLVLEVLFPGGVVSLLLSVVLIMLFGEIIPQAVCSRHALEIGSRLIGFVRVLRFLMWPIAKPIAAVLDWMLGHELGQIYSREELKGLVKIHARSKYGALTHDESLIIEGTLDFSQRSARDVLTKAENVFCLSVDHILDERTLRLILEKGYSRIPLYDGSPNNIVCSLLVKQLLLVNKNEKLPIRALIASAGVRRRVAPVIECAENALLADLLNEFQEGQSHLAIVYDDVAKSDRKFLGIVTIEDVFEFIIQEEIVDETDIFVDNTNSMLAVPHRENSLRARHHGMLTHARLPGTKAILIREIPMQSAWKPRATMDGPSKSTFFPDRRLLRQASVNRRARSDGFNLDSSGRPSMSESLPLLPDIDDALKEVRDSQLSVHLNNVEKEKLGSSVAVVDLSPELSPMSMHTSSKTIGSPDSVRSKPLPAYVPPQEVSRRSSRARASRSGTFTDNN